MSQGSVLALHVCQKTFAAHLWMSTDIKKKKII